MVNEHASEGSRDRTGLRELCALSAAEDSADNLAFNLKAHGVKQQGN